MRGSRGGCEPTSPIVCESANGAALFDDVIEGILRRFKVISLDPPDGAIPIELQEGPGEMFVCDQRGSTQTGQQVQRVDEALHAHGNVVAACGAEGLLQLLCRAACQR